MTHKRSEQKFPSVEHDLTGFLKKIWEEGWLDEYSEEHFLIKAINNNLSDIKWASQFINNNSNSFYTAIKSDGKIDFEQFTSIFLTNFSFRLHAMYLRFGEHHIKKFIKEQLSAGKEKYNEDQFFQAMSEIEVLSFFSSRCNWDNILYEPPLGENASNPEASFEINQPDNTKIKFNIEVKTPSFTLPTDKQEELFIPNILLSNEGREKIKALCDEYNITCKFPRVTKLVDFINSASKKFRVPQKNEFNLLYINWSYSDFPSNGFIEAWSLLTNELNGIITHPEIGTKLPFKKPICPEAYKKITAIIVYTSSLDQLMFTNFQHVWQGTDNNVGHRFRMFLLNNKANKEDLFDFTVMNPDIPKPNCFRCMFSIKPSRHKNKFEFSDKAINIINNYFLTDCDL